ncbi:hypothetical protein BGZ76_004309 [Entomortierella beljakovae]|nr:hypothetical protein BGZ76_004309 [Entomortierella beljakovae]
MGRPISLNTATYRDFPFISHAIPSETLSHLEKFKHVHGFLGGDGGGFLSRCRALKDLEFASFDKNAFTWAEEERKQLLGESFGDSCDPPTRLELQHLVQLRVAKITVTEWMVGQVLRSISTGFSHSLEDLHYTSYNHSQLLHILCSSELVTMELNAAPDVGFCIDTNFRLWKLKRCLAS